MTTTGTPSFDLTVPLVRLVNTDTWEGLAQLVAEHPAVVSDAADAVLAALTHPDERPAPEVVQAVAIVRYALSRCRLVGPGRALAELVDGAPARPDGRHPLGVELGHVLRHTGEAYDADPPLTAAILPLVELMAAGTDPAYDAAGAGLLAWCAALCHLAAPGVDRDRRVEAALRELAAFFSSPAAVGDLDYPRQTLDAALDELALLLSPGWAPADADAWSVLCDDLAPLVAGRDVAAAHVAFLRAAGLVHRGLDGVRLPWLDAAQVELEAALAARGARRPGQAALLRTKLGEILVLRSVDPRADLPRAAQLFRDAEAELAGIDDPAVLPLRVTARADLATVLALRDDPADLQTAAGLLQGNLGVVPAAGWPFEWVRAALLLGDLHARVGDRDTAVATYQRALVAADDEPSADAVARVHRRIGDALTSSMRPDLDGAAQAYAAAGRTWTRERCPEVWAEMAQRLARSTASVAQRRGDADDRPVLTLIHDLTAAIDIDDPARDRTRDTWREVGDLWAGIGRFADATAAYERAADAGLEVWARQVSPAARRAEVGQLDATYRRAAVCLAALGRPHDALRRLDASRARLLLAAQLEGEVHGELGDDDRERFAAAKITLAEVAHERRLGVPFPGARTEPQLSAAYRAAGRDIRNVLRRADRFRVVTSTPELTDDDLLDAVPQGGALVVPIVGPDGTAAVVVQAGATRLTDEHVLRDLPLHESELRHLLVGSGTGAMGWLRAYVDPPPVIAVGNHETTGLLWADLLEGNGAVVWDRLVGPIADRLAQLGVAAGAHVAVVADGPLTMLALHTAWDRADPVRRPFGDSYAVSFSPSIRVLRECAQRRARPPAPPRLLVIADPTDDLPSARVEAAVVARRFDGAVITLVGPDATRGAVLAALPDCTHVHLAAHASYAVDDPLASALVLAGEDELRVGELLALGANPDLRLIVLSACETSITDVEDVPNEPASLASVFLRLGAACVVGTLWEVEDVSGALVMERFYAERRGGASAPQALAAAQRQVRAATAAALAERFPRGPTHERFAAMDPVSRPFAQPFFWAPFVCTGE